MPTLAAFLNLVLGIALLIAALYGLRALWVYAVPPRVLAYLIAPGVAVHELSHAFACVITGAKVHSMVQFRSDGSGEVKHGPPKLKYVGDVIIAMAPLAGGTGCLLLLGMLLNSPINLYSVKAEGVHPSQLDFLLDLAKLVWQDIGLAVRTTSLTDWRTYVFFYFAMCFTLGMAPSRQDLKNGSVGILVLCGLALILHLVVDRLFAAKGDGPIFEFIGTLLIKLHYPFAIAAISLILFVAAYLVGEPIRRLKKRKRRR